MSTPQNDAPKRFTDRYVKALKPRDKRYMVKEQNAHGQGTLRIRVSRTGSKTWLYVFKYAGRTRFMTLGKYPEMTVAEAHKAFADANLQRERGFDPAVPHVKANAEMRRAPTVGQLAALYVEEWAKVKKKTWKRDQSLLEKKVLPRWGSRKAATIARKDVLALNRLVMKDGETTANRTFEVVRKMFNWAVDQEILDHSPCARVKKPARDTSRDRVLTHDELQRLLAGLPVARMDLSTKLAFMMFLLTAQRPIEVMGATWDEISIGQRQWTIPGSRTKNGEPQPVPLSGLAMRGLDAAAQLRQGRYVFPSVRGDSPMVETALSRAVRRNLATLGDPPDFVPYDLRRTAVSEMARQGVPRLVVDKVLNHGARRRGDSTWVYDRYSYDQEKRAALEGWEGCLRDLGADTAVELICAAVGQRTGAAWWKRRRAARECSDHPSCHPHGREIG